MPLPLNTSGCSPDPPTSPTLNSESGALLCVSKVSQNTIQPSTINDGLSSAERNTKVGVVEIPPLPQPPQPQTILQQHRPKVAMESRRVRAALEAPTKTLYEHDKVVWLQRAATYEHQLQEISAAHAATEREMRTTIDDRLREISSLRRDLMKKDAMIEDIGLRCDELSTALASVREELKGERGRSQAQRKQEMRDLEARLMSSIQVGRACI